MKLIFPAVAAVALACLLVVAGPALSARPYLPEPVQFEIVAPPAEPSAGGAREDVVSAPIHAGRRFDMVGLNWSGDAAPRVALRVRATGERWGRWTDVPAADGTPDPGAEEGSARGASEPVWAGRSDWVQYRISQSPPDLRLSFVNTTGTATAVDRIETGLRQTANRALTTAVGSSSASAGDAQPDMVSREEWGASACPPRDRPESGDVRLGVVHHTATANDYSRADGAAMVLGICLFHRNSRDWDDIGYNFLVDKYGTIYEGRAGGADQPIIGAHAQGFNAQSTGIASLGTHETTSASSAALRAMARIIRWKLPLHGARTQGPVKVVSAGGELNRWPEGERVRLNSVSGHRKVDYTSCPGDTLERQLDRLRKLSDADPPERPRRLTAEPDGEDVALDWAKSDAPDLGGYKVYRARSDGSWREIADRSHSRSTDRDAKSDRTHVYRVTAYDRREPANVSEPSPEATVMLDGPG